MDLPYEYSYLKHHHETQYIYFPHSQLSNSNHTNTFGELQGTQLLI